MSTFLRDVYKRQRAAMLAWDLAQVGEVQGEQFTLAQAYKHCRVDTYETGSPPLTVSDDDTWLEEIGIPAAREYCEAYKGRAFAPRTIELTATAFPSRAISTTVGPYVELPFGPVQSIESVKYLDDAAADAAYTTAYDAAYAAEFGSSGDVTAATAAGVAAGDIASAAALDQTVDPSVYVLDATTVPARLILAYGEIWPTARAAVASVRIRYVAGYSLTDDSPQMYVLPKMARAAMALMLSHLYEHRGDESDVDLPMAVKALLGLVHGERLGFA